VEPVIGLISVELVTGLFSVELLPREFIVDIELPNGIDDNMLTTELMLAVEQGTMVV